MNSKAHMEALIAAWTILHKATGELASGPLSIYRMVNHAEAAIDKQIGALLHKEQKPIVTYELAE